MAQDGGGGVLQRQPAGSLKDLDDAAVALHLHDTAGAGGAVLELQFDHLLKPDAVDAFQCNKGAVDLAKSHNFQTHTFASLLAYATVARARSILP